MSIVDINNTLTNITNQTEKTLFANRTTGTAELGQDAFLQLMMKQMQYQDPMNPMDNSQMLQQQAQFTQISELQKLNTSISNSNSIMQASSLIGQTVSIPNPDNPTEMLEGKVTEAKFYDNGASVILDGDSEKEYPLGYVMGIKDGSTDDSTT